MTTLETVPTDTAAWERARLYVAAVTRRRGIRPVDAEDIINTVLMKVYTHRANVKTHFRGYLSVTARNEITQFYRHRATAYIPPITEALGGDTGTYVLGAATPVYAAQSARDPADIAEERETVQAIIALCWAVLTPSMLRTVALLAQGLSNADAALCLGCSAVNIRVTKHRAKVRLQEAGIGIN